MKGDYPRFKATYTHEELVEHFLLTPAERAVVDTCYGDANRHAVAVLLKTIQHLGYFPDDLQHIPLAVRTFIAHQLQLLWDHTTDYPWHSSTRDRHVAMIRQHPDYHYLKKVFQHTRELLQVELAPPARRLPELLTDAELVAFYEAIWHARQLTHVVMLKLLLYTGIRNAELVQLRLTDVDLQTCQLRVTQGKGHKDRYVLFPQSFRGELAQYLERQQAQDATYLFESNRHRPYSTRRIRQLVKQYATAAGIAKRVYPHLFRHQFITYLTRQGVISPKLQLLSGHATEQSLAVYRELALSDVAEEYEAAMHMFPVK